MTKKNKFRENIENQEFKDKSKLNRNLNSFSVKIIKIVGVVGVIIGLVILIAFWYWLIRLLFKIG